MLAVAFGAANEILYVHLNIAKIKDKIWEIL